VSIYDPAPAASLLSEAWRLGKPLGTLPEQVRPRSMSEAYDVQDRLISNLGHSVAGWKLGLGSKNAKRRNGIESPVFGRVLEPGLYAAGDTVRIPGAMAVAIEFEIAFILDRDILPEGPPEGPNELASEAANELAKNLVSSSHVAFEFVVSRFGNHDRLDTVSITADNGMAYAVLLGEAIDLTSIAVPDLARSLTIHVNGEDMAHGLAGDDLVDPFAALDELLLHARERHIVLEKGALIMTGSLSAPIRFKPGCSAYEVLAHYLRSELRCTVSQNP